MVTSNYISINSIFSALLVNPLMEGITPSDIARYTFDIIALMGVPLIYDNKVVIITIEDYRGNLPCDLLYIQQTRNQDGLPMRYSADTFTSAYHDIGSPDVVNDYDVVKDLYYSLNHGKIYTSFESGVIEMSFKAIAVDEDGLPLIPDHIKFKRTVEAYIKLKWYEIQWELGKISDKVLQRADQEYCWNVGAAQNYGKLQTIDQAETFRGAFTRLITNNTAASKSFTNFGQQEYIKTGSI